MMRWKNDGKLSIDKTEPEKNSIYDDAAEEMLSPLEQHFLSPIHLHIVTYHNYASYFFRTIRPRVECGIRFFTSSFGRRRSAPALGLH